jgi:hypothetical protein
MPTKLKLLVPNAIIASAGLVLASSGGHGSHKYFSNTAIAAHANTPAKDHNPASGQQHK